MAVIVLLVNAVFGGIGALIRGVLGLLVAQAGSALTTTFAMATLAQAYHQLVDLEPETAEPSGDEAAGGEEEEDEGDEEDGE